MNNIQKAHDFLNVFTEKLNSQEQYVLNNVFDAMLDGHTGCICHTIPKSMKIKLEKIGCTIHNEIEDDNIYYIVSWGEEIIA